MIDTLNKITGDTPFGRLELSIVRSHAPLSIVEAWEGGSCPAIYSLKITDDRIIVNENDLCFYSANREQIEKVALYFFALWSQQIKDNEHSTQATPERKENHPNANASASGFKGGVWVNNHQQSETETDHSGW